MHIHTLVVTEEDWDAAAARYAGWKPSIIDDADLVQCCALTVAADREWAKHYPQAKVHTEASDALYVELTASEAINGRRAYECRSFTAPNFDRVMTRFDRYVRRRSTKPKKWPIVLTLEPYRPHSWVVG